ncbi:hypothetical protein KIW84_075314 [Lathyrus oleraceus]|uniref:Terpene synthase metal-binding domain-containing protein n=2 Tax=Pisum sativum TaxID=3888 RepID=A0A9D4VUZ5_PEA|nr:hypothetical protein KIW84_075314 [Pisum sativum]
MGLASKLRFSRDRLTECFFWAVGMTSEYEFGDLSKSLTKVISLITTLDDLYDVYGTLDELELFTTAVESWDIKAVHVLPEYMKIVFLALYNTINELSYHVLKDHELDAIPYFTKAWSDLLKSFLQEAKWCKEEELPKFNDYMNNACVSSSGVVLLVHTYFMLNHNITKQSLEALDNCHALLRSPSLIFRLCNDMVTYKAELQRGEKVNSIMCYMNENGVSEEVAYEYIQCLLNETWKKLNRDTVIDSPFLKDFTKIAINLARTAHCVYQDGDGHGVPDATTKNRICSLIIEPISLMENDT